MVVQSKGCVMVQNVSSMFSRNLPSHSDVTLIGMIDLLVLVMVLP